MNLKGQVADSELQNIERKVKDYEFLSETFKQKWADFEEQHWAEISELDAIREDRNVKLDEIKRSLRTYAEGTNDSSPVEVGTFKVIKKTSKFYDGEKLLSKLRDEGLYELAVAEELVVQTIEIAKYEKVKAFLEKYGKAEAFLCCEDSMESGVAVYGPKSVPMLGAELPKE